MIEKAIEDKLAEAQRDRDDAYSRYMVAQQRYDAVRYTWHAQFMQFVAEAEARAQKRAHGQGEKS